MFLIKSNICEFSFKIKSGYENAVYAALMHELDATLNNKSSKKWITKKIDNLKAVKNPLSNYVNGPKELDLILSQIFLVEKKFMKGLPIIKTTSNEVKTASPVLTVKYLNTFKNEKISTKFNMKL